MSFAPTADDPDIVAADTPSMAPSHHLQAANYFDNSLHLGWLVSISARLAF